MHMKNDSFLLALLDLVALCSTPLVIDDMTVARVGVFSHLVCLFLKFTIKVVSGWTGNRLDLMGYKNLPHRLLSTYGSPFPASNPLKSSRYFTHLKVKTTPSTWNVHKVRLTSAHSSQPSSAKYVSCPFWISKADNLAICEDVSLDITHLPSLRSRKIGTWCEFQMPVSCWEAIWGMLLSVNEYKKGTWALWRM